MTAPLVILLSLTIAFTQYEAVLALSQIDRYCTNRYCPYYSNEKDACGGGGVSGPSNLPASVPEPFNKIFSAAAAKFNADPFIVAVIYYTENRGWREPPPPYGNGRPWAVSSAGAMGPMQFLPGTWESHKQDGNNDGKKEILDLTDASFGTAHFVVAIGGKAGIPLGNPSDPRSVKPSVVDVLASYNAGPNDPTPNSAETRQYIQIGVKIYNQLKSGQPATTNTTETSSGAEICGSGSTAGMGVSGDGFVFPLRTTKPKMTRNAYWSPRCKNPVSHMGALGRTEKRGDLCHHDYLAADIQTPAGTVVLAPRPGRVLRTSYSSVAATCFGSNISIYSDKALGGDGNTYYLTHLGMKHNVDKGDTVKAGDAVSTIGPSGSCFQPHLHIDISPVQTGFTRNSSIGTAGPLLDPQPPLIAAYQKLPEN